jgi:hypothetical protein
VSDFGDDAWRYGDTPGCRANVLDLQLLMAQPG